MAAKAATKEKINGETGEVIVEASEQQHVQLPATVPPGTQVQITTPPAAELPRTGFTNLTTAIALITAGIADPENRVSKTGYNKFQNYHYASMQDILQKLAPLMAQHGLVVMQNEVNKNYVDDGAAISITYEFTIIHKSGEVWPQKQHFTGLSRCRDSKGGFDDKAINKCHTAARKYFLLALFQVPTEDENDADKGTNHDSGYGSAAAEKVKEPPKKPEAKKTERFAPHEISVAGKKFVQWAQEYIEQVNLCEKATEVLDYGHMNADALHKMETGAPDLYAKCTEAVKARLVALT
jgi:hypothetical protein